MGGEHGAVQYGGDYATEYFGFGGYPGANSTAGLAGLTASYDYYADNSADGTITITYDDGAPGAPLNLAGTGRDGRCRPRRGTRPRPAGTRRSPTTSSRSPPPPMATSTIFDDGVSATTGTEVTGLTNGVTYFFRVAAINDEGAGSAATTTIAIVPSDVPAPPTVTGLGAVRCRHPRRLHAGRVGRADHRRTSTGSMMPATGRSAPSPANRLTISGLTNGQAYSVAIRSRNIIGPSDASTPQQSATPRDVAQAPTALLADATHASVGLSWEAPIVDNGAPVTDYLVQMATTVGGPYETFADGDIGVDLGDDHRSRQWHHLLLPCRRGERGGRRRLVDLGDRHPAPGAGRAVDRARRPADGALTVAITPGFDGGSVVTGYEYRLGASGSWKSTGSTTTGFVIAGLANATSYDVFVHAINAAGPSLASTVVSGVPRTVPAAPAIATVALDTGAVSVSFIVGSDGGSPLTNVEYSTDGGTHWVTRSPASTLSPVTIGDLVGGQTYPVRLRVVNDAGFSAASNISSVTAKGTPDAPVISIAAADRALVVTFTAPANGGTPITNYEYSLDGGATWTPRSPTATSSPLVIGGSRQRHVVLRPAAGSERRRQRSAVEHGRRRAADRAGRADARFHDDRRCRREPRCRLHRPGLGRRQRHRRLPVLHRCRRHLARASDGEHGKPAAHHHDLVQPGRLH